MKPLMSARMRAKTQFQPRRLVRNAVSSGWILLACATTSCSYNASNQKVSLFPMRSVHVEPDDNVVAALFPEAEPLADEESIRRQTYSVEESGGFTFTRTVERQVAHLSVSSKILDVEAATERHVPPFEGVLVSRVPRDGAARKAGVRKGDVLRQFRGELVHSPEQLKHLIRDRSSPKEVVRIELLRKGESLTVDVTLGTETEIVGSQTFYRTLPILDDRDRTGITLLEVPYELLPLVYGLPAADGGEPRGVQIVEMVPGTPAFFSKLELGDYIVRVGDQTVDSIADYVEAVGQFEAGDDVPFEVEGFRDRHKTTAKGTARIDYGVTATHSKVDSSLRNRLPFPAGNGRKPIRTAVTIDDNACAKRHFDLLGLLSFSKDPDGSLFKFIWGLVFQHKRRHVVSERQEKWSETEWEFALNFFSYEGTRTSKTFRIAWFFPITVGSG
jgi:PDZ domain-containing secreted protein